MADWALATGERQEYSFASVARTGGANVKGAYAQLIAATGFAYTAITLQMYAGGGGGSCYLVDLAIGAAGQEQMIVPNILLDSMRTINMGAISITLPIAIPAGARVAARLQEVGGSGTRSVQMALVGRAGGSNTPQPTAGDAVTYGANMATSNGTLVDQGAVANTFGAFVELTSGTTRDHSFMAIVLGTNQQTNNGSGELNLQLAIGPAGAEVPIAEFRTVGTALGTRLVIMNFDIAAQVPAGTRLSMRAKSTAVTSVDRIVTAILIGC
jgi:hypothetical protein